MVGTDGIVYQKDLGEKTTDVAQAMEEYNPGDDWKPGFSLLAAGKRSTNNRERRNS